MKKVRISKKNPNRILKAIQTAPSPNKELHHLPKTIKNSIKIQQLKHHLESHKFSYHQYTIQSHRYKPSNHFQQQKIRVSCSPHQQLNWKSQQKQKQDHSRHSSRRYHGLRQIFHRSTDKSPYLQRKHQNNSQRKLILSTKNILQQSSRANKQFKTIRYNSHEQKQQSLQVRRLNNSEQILKQAKKLMLAGQSRKSMFILKPLLHKEPLNLNALNIAAINLFNIGEYQRSAQYLDFILKLSPGFNQNVYILRAKIYFRHSKNLQECLSKFQECSQIFPNSEQVQIEKGQIYFSTHKYDKALACFKAAQQINPKSCYVQEKIIQVYQIMKKSEKILEAIENFKKISGNVDKFNQIKVKTLAKLKKYDQIIKQFSQNNDPIILYYYGLALYKKNDSLKAFLILQSSLQNSQDCTKSIKLMILILCKGNDFYEAYHLKQRCQYLSVNKDMLKRQFFFIEGVICLMKRNIQQAVFKINLACQESMSIQDDQFQKYMKSIASMFLAYAQFSLGNYEKCKTLYENQLKNFPENKFEGISYNIQLNSGFFHYQEQQLQKAAIIFQKLVQDYEQKIQPHFCLGIIYVNIFFKQRDKQNVENLQLLKKAKQLFQSSSNLVEKFHNNIGANFFYHKSVLHAFLEQWRQAILTIDQAIQKSEENYWRYYYLRGLILACIHNFSQAINDCSAAINLKDIEPSPYLLRSCCFQIEGQGNCAFKDLQAYIALRPKDKKVHKFAGKLLFENGAFQDAIAAFNHQPIPQLIQNQDVFLTKSKTFFLLGRFNQAAQQMLKVNKINPQKKQALFDAKMIMILNKLLDGSKRYDQIITQINLMYADKNLTFSKSQIFKKTECHTLKSICYFYSQRYKQTISELENAINAKQKIIMKQCLIQGTIREDQKDTLLYACQMNFNISLCYLIMGDIPNALCYANRMVFNVGDSFYEPHFRYLNILLGKTKNILSKQDQPIKVQIFPNRNKISHYIEEVILRINNATIYSKLCIPFPKVEPPQIFPTFDQKLLRQFTIQRVQRKSQAPWICKEENIVKFTSKMQKYSRLEIQQSGTQMSSSEKQIDNSHISMQSIISRRSKINTVKSYQNQF